MPVAIFLSETSKRFLAADDKWLIQGYIQIYALRLISVSSVFRYIL